MEKLSPEDISRAREWRETKYELTNTVWTDELVAAYSAAENERLTKERGDAVNAMQVWEATAQQCGLAHSAAEAKCDRLKGALRDMVVIAQQDGWHNALTGRQIVLEAAEAALRPEPEA